MGVSQEEVERLGRVRVLQPLGVALLPGVGLEVESFVRVCVQYPVGYCIC